MLDTRTTGWYGNRVCHPRTLLTPSESPKSFQKSTSSKWWAEVPCGVD